MRKIVFLSAAALVGLSACAPGESIGQGQREVISEFDGQMLRVTYSPDNSTPARVTAADGSRLPEVLSGSQSYSTFIANTIGCSLAPGPGARVVYDDLEIEAVVAETAC